MAHLRWIVLFSLPSRSATKTSRGLEGAALAGLVKVGINSTENDGVGRRRHFRTPPASAGCFYVHVYLVPQR